MPPALTFRVCWQDNVPVNASNTNNSTMRSNVLLRAWNEPPGSDARCCCTAPVEFTPAVTGAGGALPVVYESPFWICRMIRLFKIFAYSGLVLLNGCDKPAASMPSDKRGTEQARQSPAISSTTAGSHEESDGRRDSPAVTGTSKPDRDLGDKRKSGSGTDAKGTFTGYDPATYNYRNPTFVKNDFSKEQKAAQRRAGTEMMQALVEAARSGRASYTIAPGTYRVPVHVYNIQGISNFTVFCPGVDIWLEGLNAPPDANGHTDGRCWLSFSYCTNVKVLGGNTNFDSEDLQFIQATVTGWDVAAGTIDVQVMDGYNAAGFGAQEGNMSWIYDRAGICKLRPSYSGISDLDPSDPTKKRLTVGSGYFSSGVTANLQVGDIFFTRHNGGAWNPVVSCLRDSTNVEVDGINSWHGPLWVCDCSSGAFITKNCSNYRRPGTNRLGGSGEPVIYCNMMTLVWDNNTAGGPGQDDGIDAFNNTAYSVAAAASNAQGTVTLTTSPNVGDKLSFYDPYTFVPQGSARVVSSTPIDDRNERAALGSGLSKYQQSIGSAYTNFDANTPFWTVRLDKSLPVTAYAGVDNDAHSPDITVTNSYFADMNSQALFVKSHKVTVTGNRIDRSNATAIHAQLSRHWEEGPTPQNVTITNNIINDNPCAYGAPGGMWGWAISSIGVCVEGNLPGVGAINNVVISGNTINRSARVPIMVANASNVKITGNTMTAPMPGSPTDAWLAYDSYGFVPCGAIFVAASRGVTLSGNVLQSPTIFCPDLVQLGPYNEVGSISGEDVAGGWKSTTIGSESKGSGGTYAADSGAWTLRSNVADIGGQADRFLYVNGAARGDHMVTAKLTSMTGNTTGLSKAGVMFRESTGSSSKMAVVSGVMAAGAKPTFAVQFQWRAADSAAVENAALLVPPPSPANPLWLGLKKSDANFTAWYSRDSVHWSHLGLIEPINFSKRDYLVGLSAVSGNPAGALNSATFENVRYADVWNAEGILPADINNRGQTGGGSYDFASDVWTVQGGGSDVAGAEDEFTYVSGPTGGNRTLTVRITDMADADASAKSGLMFRADKEAGSAMVNIAVTHSQGVVFTWRGTAGKQAEATTAGEVPGPAAGRPVWLKLVKNGPACSGYYSIDGTNWLQVGAAESPAIDNAHYLAGLSVTSHARSSEPVNISRFAGVNLR